MRVHSNKLFVNYTMIFQEEMPHWCNSSSSETAVFQGMISEYGLCLTGRGGQIV